MNAHNSTIGTLAGERLDRREFVATLLDRAPEALVVTGLGSPSYDVFAAGERDRNFYLWGAMGGRRTHRPGPRARSSGRVRGRHHR